MSKYEDFSQTNRIWFFSKDEVPKYHEIDIDLMIAGDTDSAYLTIPKVLTDGKTNEEIIATCDQLGRDVDATFPDFIQRIFNCPDDRKNTIRTDREAVSDKSFFLTKKRYIMHLVDMEGAPPKPGHELKIMGVELKKSDTSEAVKIMLRELVDAILDGCDMATVLQMVTDMRINFQNRFTVNQIVTPVSCKTLKAAEDIYRTTGEMKGIAWQARAAMFYNKIKTKNDRPVYTGDKINVIYIKGEESKYIGFPADADELPEWINNLIIDYDTQWAKAEKKLTNYLTAMGWDIASRRKKQAEDLFGF